MENSTSKSEILKPVALKVGIPIVLSLAGFIYSKIMSKRSVHVDTAPVTHVSPQDTNSQLTCEESFHGFDSMDTNFMNALERLENWTQPNLEEEILGLRGRVEELQRKEYELELKFIKYCELKEQESINMIMELRNMLLLEMDHVEFFDKQICSIETQSKKLEKFVEDYMRVLEQLEHCQSENRLLHRKVKKLCKKTRAQASLMQERDLKIEVKETELLRSQDVIEERANAIKRFEDEVKNMKMILGQLEEEKDQLLKKLELANKSAATISEIEAEGITMEDYKKLANEVEQLQQNKAAEMKEQIYLRWSNACLRRELIKNNHQNHNENHLELDFEGHLEIETYGSKQDLDDCMILEHNNENCFGFANTEQTCSKRSKLLKKLRRWVEGNHKGKEKLEEKESNEVKCFKTQSVSDESEENFQARRSCSSA